MRSPFPRSCVLVALICVCAVIVAATTWQKGPISVVIRSSAETSHSGTPIVLQVAITNNSKQDYSFSTCPDPYSMTLTTAGHAVEERKHPLPPGGVEMLVCARSIVYVIHPGETWKDEIHLDERYDLSTPGIYFVRVEWKFPVNDRQVGPHEFDADTLVVHSNDVSFTIAP